MRGFTLDYNLVTLSTLPETLKALAAEPARWKVFAGGTDLMVLFESGKLNHKEFLNLAAFRELRKIEVTDQEVRIGALSTYTDIQNHPVIQKEFPLLARSGWVTGAKAIQNRGTIGGNIANASPAADTPPSLIAYDAQIELMSASGVRQVPYQGFHLDYKKMLLQSGEIISAVRVPRSRNWTHHYYRKVGTRAFQSISKVAVSAAARVEQGVVQDIQIGFASIAAIPLTATELRKSLLGVKISQIKSDQIAQQFVKSLNPLTDIRSTAEYRKAVVERVTSHLVDVLKEPPGFYLES